MESVDCWGDSAGVRDCGRGGVGGGFFGKFRKFPGKCAKIGVRTGHLGQSGAVYTARP